MADELETQDAQTALVNADGSFAENWRDSLPEDIRGEESLKLFNDFPSAMKSLVHAQKNMGKGKVILPTDKSTEAEVADFFKAIGRPETPDDYKAELPDDLKEFFTEDRMKADKEFCHKVGITQKQYEQWVKYQVETAQKLLADQEQFEQNRRAEVERNLRNEFKGAYDERIHAAKMLIKEVFKGNGEAEMHFLEQFGDNPEFIRFASFVAAKMVESKSLIAELTHDTPGEARAKIKELQAIAYDRTKSIQERQDATNKMKELYKTVYPEESARTTVSVGG